MSSRLYNRILKKLSNPNICFAFIDLFAGAGGTSEGVRKAKAAEVVACANHDKVAIESHAANHPDAIHFVEDIRTLDLTMMKKLVADIRRLYPHIKIVLWASLECTHFSKAKGGESRDADSRTLAKSLYMVYDPDHDDSWDGYSAGDSYIQVLQPDYIQIENVVEFMSWGPLTAGTEKISNHDMKTKVLSCPIIWSDKLGKFQPKKWVPESKTKGKDYMLWRETICNMGYREDWRELNAADYGAFTSRNRLFGIFAKGDLPIIWPTPTHSKVPQKANLFGSSTKKWRPVRECIDFTKEGISIFNRKKSLVPKTLERIYAGLVKFVAKGDTSFLSKYYSGHPDSKNIPVTGPADTITSKDHHSLITIDPWIMNYYSGSPECRNKSVDDPCNVIRTENCQYLVSPEFLVKFNNNETFKDLNDSCPTLTTKDKLGLVLMKYHGRGENLLDPEGACSTITTKDRIGAIFLDQQYGNSKPASTEEPAATLTVNPKLCAYFIDRNFTSGGGKHVDVDRPMGALMTVPKANLISCDGWLLTNAFQKTGTSLDDPANTVVATGMRQYLMSTNFDNIGRSLDEPSPTITADRHHHYLMNPQFASKGGSIDDPSFTLIARMDKMPPYLIEARTGAVVIIIYEDDSEIMKKIKMLMAHYGIYDVKMRMLLIKELKKIQGFGEKYILKGTQTDQKKFIGNAVVSDVVEAWINAMEPFVKKYDSQYKSAA